MVRANYQEQGFVSAAHRGLNETLALANSALMAAREKTPADYRADYRAAITFNLEPIGYCFHWVLR